MKLFECQDCAEKKRGELYEDPRDPPLDTEPCLCVDCYKNALEQELENTTMLVYELNAKIKHANEVINAGLLQVSAKTKKPAKKAKRK